MILFLKYFLDYMSFSCCCVISHVQYHLSELTRQLGFEDDLEAKDFCEHHGVNFTTDCQIVDRARFVDPEVAFTPRRALNLIHSKLTTTLAEVQWVAMLTTF